MPCYKPLQAWRSRARSDNGRLGITFRLSEGYADLPVTLPCGQCIGCRLERSRQWAVRIMHEAQLHPPGTCHFVTLTYDENNVPTGLCKRDVQLFLKRVRKRYGKFRYFYCGEYGDNTSRPHYHLCLFGIALSDLESFKGGKYPLSSSASLSDLWGHGFVVVGELNFETAAYTARYIIKKVTGDAADKHYERVDPSTGEVVKILPEFINMSLRPAVGRGWLERFQSDVYPSDEVITRGVACKPPRYYDKILDRVDPQAFLHVQDQRRSKFCKSSGKDSRPERLAVREKVAQAKLAQSKRSL